MYPKAKHRVCLVHVSRQLSSKIRAKDCKEILHGFKVVYQFENYEFAHESLVYFKLNWGKTYPKVIVNMMNNKCLLVFYNFPSSIRLSIYSTNLIKGFNNDLKRQFKRKEQFPNEYSLEHFLVTRS